MLVDRIAFDESSASCVAVERSGQVPTALAEVGLIAPIPVVVIVGGAGGLTDMYLPRLAELFRAAVMPLVDRVGGAVVTGGTASGAIRLVGQARRHLGSRSPLIGVAPLKLVQWPGWRDGDPERTELEAHHSHFVLVPGDVWGSEVPWIDSVASALALDSPSVTVLVNGGDIAYLDIEQSVSSGRRVLVLAETGRAADEIASARRGGSADARAKKLATSGLITIASGTDAPGVRDALANLM